jgi:hypothetical protein
MKSGRGLKDPGFFLPGLGQGQQACGAVQPAPGMNVPRAILWPYK